jgi:hypothetical protein
MAAVISGFSVRDVFGDPLPALIVISRVPVFAVSTAMEILSTVGTRIGSRHLDSFKIDFLPALETEMMAFFNFWNIHGILVVWYNLNYIDPGIAANRQNG